MGFSIGFWYLLPLLALVPYLYKRAKEKAAAAPVTTISLARYRLLASIIQQRKIASGPAKVPTFLFIAAALAIVASSQPSPGIPAAGHDVAVVVGMEVGGSMNVPTSGGTPRLSVATGAAKGILQGLAPGDPIAVVIHDHNILVSFPLGYPPVIASHSLDSVTTGSGGNRPGLAMVEAARILSGASAPRRVAVLFNDGDGIFEEDPSEALAILSKLPPVEGYLVSVGESRRALEAYGAAAGWTVVDLAQWSPSQVASGPATGGGEFTLPLGAILAAVAFALVAFGVLREARRA
ncbi:MAG: vWA domain-containing protein [Halobacteria archaeon]